jgi:hypothetical protein
MRRFLVTATLKEGSEDAVRAILSKGPPFQLPETSLERHFVFLTSNELVFVFEGARAEEEVARLLSDSGVLGQASELGSHIEGPPRTPREVFHWERPQLIEGLSFGPLPGAGDSEGG